jgi:hypothetical protein
MTGDRLILSEQLSLLIASHDWQQGRQVLDQLKGGDDSSQFAYGAKPVPIGCYSILMARLQGTQPDAHSSSETRQLMRRRVEASPEIAPLLSNLAVVDALIGNKEDAISEAKRAANSLPISKDAIDGPRVAMNLAVVYAWTNEPALAFEQLNALSDTSYGLFYNHLKLDPYFDPLRKDSRFDELLTRLAPH